MGAQSGHNPTPLLLIVAIHCPSGTSTRPRSTVGPSSPHIEALGITTYFDCLTSPSDIFFYRLVYWLATLLRSFSSVMVAENHICKRGKNAGRERALILRENYSPFFSSLARPKKSFPFFRRETFFRFDLSICHFFGLIVLFFLWENGDKMKEKKS